MQEKNKDTLIRVLCLVVIILMVIIVQPYFRASTAQPATPAMAGMMNVNANSPTDFTNPAMPGMMLKTFPLDTVDSSKTVPTIAFTFDRDTLADGWNLHLITTHFTFTPQLEDQAAIANQGHVHLYIDGVLTVVYGPWFHVDALAPGPHTITVALAANDHSLFTYGGAKIQATQTIASP